MQINKDIRKLVPVIYDVNSGGEMVEVFGWLLGVTGVWGSQ
ncbi:MAG: hypothetical protein ACYST3_05060 [Planctomycetota bacterium]|jgi:hypothetical protein